MWQVLYEELRGQGFEIVAVALDAGGTAAVEASIRCPDLAERPGVLASLMGWSEDQWARAGVPTFTCLVDERHLLSELYDMKNVPLAVWIDEDGRIVRPTEPAGASDNFRQLDAETFALPEDEVERLQSNRSLYWDALRDWVRNGADSPYAMSADEVRERRHRPDEQDVRAATHARIGHHLFGQGDAAGAEQHFREAVRLCPHKWNYRRQAMVLDPGLVGELNTAPEFFETVGSLGDRSYYDEVDIPGMRPDPLVKEFGGGAPD